MGGLTLSVGTTHSAVNSYGERTPYQPASMSSGDVTADCGRFAYVLYVKEEDLEQAARVLDAG